MKELNIQIPEGHEIDTDNSDLSKGKVVFKVKSGLPDRWEDLGAVDGFSIAGDYFRSSTDAVLFDTVELSKAAKAIAQLSHLRAKAWGDWRPDYGEDDGLNHVIAFKGGKIVTDKFYMWSEFLAFPTPELRDEFLEKYRDLIEQARPILGGGV